MAQTTNYNLPYPSDYTEQADVPEAIKDLAEATDGVLEDKYEKPSGGIPSTDMTSAVQKSLGKADTALQSTDIVSSVDSSSTNSKAVGAKLFYDTIGDINSALDLINGESI